MGWNIAGWCCCAHWDPRSYPAVEVWAAVEGERRSTCHTAVVVLEAEFCVQVDDSIQAFVQCDYNGSNYLRFNRHGSVELDLS